MRTTEEIYDVGIVGWGPIGQFAALLLGRQGRRVVVFERWPAMYDLPRAVLFDHEIARVLQSGGLADQAKAISEPGVIYEWMNADGERLLFFDWTRPGPSGWPTANMFSQPDLQRVLDRAAKALPSVEVNQGWVVEEAVDAGTVVFPRIRGHLNAGSVGARQEDRPHVHESQPTPVPAGVPA